MKIRHWNYFEQTELYNNSFLLARFQCLVLIKSTHLRGTYHSAQTCVQTLLLFVASFSQADGSAIQHDCREISRQIDGLMCPRRHGHPILPTSKLGAATEKCLSGKTQQHSPDRGVEPDTSRTEVTHTTTASPRLSKLNYIISSFKLK